MEASGSPNIKREGGGAVPAKRIGEWRPVAWFGHCATTRNRWWMTMVMNDRTASGTGEIRDVHRPQVRRRVDREPQSVRRAALLENGPRRHRNRNGLRQLQRVSTQSSIFFYTSSFYSSLSSKSYHNGLTYPLLLIFLIYFSVLPLFSVIPFEWIWNSYQIDSDSKIGYFLTSYFSQFYK